MDTAIVIKRLVGQDAMSNFTMASAEALKKTGKVTVFTFAYERPPVEGVEIRLMGGKNSHSMGTNLEALAGAVGLARELSKYDVLLMVDPDVGPMPACRLALRYNPKLRVMWTFHGLTPVQYVSGARDRWLMRIRKFFYVRSMRRADMVQVFSQFIKKEVLHWGIDPSRVVVMPLGVEPGGMRGDGGKVRSRYGIGDKFVVLYVGRLANFKHVDELIKAVSTLDDACLLIVGDGPERENLRKLIKELHMDSRAWLAGRVPDGELPDYYAACDAWATASRHEGFCVPVIEAMSAAKPVVVPDTGAMPETAGPAGLVYRPGDVADLAKKLGMLIKDKALYSSLSSRAEERVREFDMQAVLRQYVGLCSR
ncbi:putative glycosyltransferase [Methanocella paludicola SANAE]|uniref:Glycosyltransferase n=1 Tax=Methanocella paludicola (strain DSM 17711 / JCM 13418 / NBRC 101707 / SANAE) TaxID=304371 RepID=D1Z258_METPS|nr:glycosyltransferase family 1 protein [Methanocella paludicola]BAI62780.1 putative glycosyltransferase [Methanocella paludicola SANAE]